MIVLSCYQVNPALRAREQGQNAIALSTDLNRTSVQVRLDAGGITFPDGQLLSWDDAARIAEAETHCFALDSGTIRPIQTYSEITNWPRSLFPTGRAPTVLVSGKPMHRIAGIDPYEDTLRKIKAIGPLRGAVLDTATGLGYTAIEASRSAERVVTVDIDPAALEIARANPWSCELFDNPKIEQIVDDMFGVIDTFDDHSFTSVIHDPPAFALAGDLYSGEFYRGLHRVLQNRGRLFHYVGDPNSKSGRGVSQGVARRLEEAGFSRIQRRPEAYGLLAIK